MAVSVLADYVFRQDLNCAEFLNLTVKMHQGEDFQIAQIVSIVPLEHDKQTVGMMVELYGIRLICIFTEDSNLESNKKNQALILRFCEHPKKLSCVIEIK